MRKFHGKIKNQGPVQAELHLVLYCGEKKKKENLIILIITLAQELRGAWASFVQKSELVLAGISLSFLQSCSLNI